MTPRAKESTRVPRTFASSDVQRFDRLPRFNRRRVLYEHRPELLDHRAAGPKSITAAHLIQSAQLLRHGSLTSSNAAPTRCTCTSRGRGTPNSSTQIDRSVTCRRRLIARRSVATRSDPDRHTHSVQPAQRWLEQRRARNAIAGHFSSFADDKRCRAEPNGGPFKCKGICPPSQLRRFSSGHPSHRRRTAFNPGCRTRFGRDDPVFGARRLLRSRWVTILTTR